MMLRQEVFAAAAKSLQLCPTLCDPVEGSPPVSPIPGILQARAVYSVPITIPGDWDAMKKNLKI